MRSWIAEPFRRDESGVDAFIVVSFLAISMFAGPSRTSSNSLIGSSLNPLCESAFLCLSDAPASSPPNLSLDCHRRSSPPAVSASILPEGRTVRLKLDDLRMCGTTRAYQQTYRNSTLFNGFLGRHKEDPSFSSFFMRASLFYTRLRYWTCHIKLQYARETLAYRTASTGTRTIRPRADTYSFAEQHSYHSHIAGSSGGNLAIVSWRKSSGEGVAKAAIRVCLAGKHSILSSNDTTRRYYAKLDGLGVAGALSSTKC